MQLKSLSSNNLTNLLSNDFLFVSISTFYMFLAYISLIYIEIAVKDTVLNNVGISGESLHFLVWPQRPLVEKYNCEEKSLLQLNLSIFLIGDKLCYSVITTW